MWLRMYKWCMGVVHLADSNFSSLVSAGTPTL